MLKAPSPRALVLLACLLALFVALPFFVGPYGLKFATRLIVISIFVVSLDFLLGLGGLVSFGHAAFFGVGAYAVYFISSDEGAANAFLALGAGVGLAAVCALAIGAFACLTRGFYFIMVTLAAGQMMFSLFHDTDIAKGSDGAYINIKPDVTIAGHTLLDFDDRRSFFYVCLFFLIVALLALFWLARTPFGRIVQGLKANDARLSALGYDVYRAKLAAFVVSGAVAGLAGALFACIDGFVTPDLFAWRQSGLAIMMVVLGGAGTLFGPILGALAYISLEEALKTASLVGDFVSAHWRLGTGLTLVIAVLLSPDGLAGFLRAAPRVSRRTRAAPSRPPAAARKASTLATRTLSKTFGGLRAVDDVTVSFAPDLVHAIIGPNGAGKTTFTNLLSGALKPSAGEVLVDGKNVAGMPAHTIARRGVGRSFQRTNIFGAFTVEENCRLAAQAAHPAILRFVDARRSEDDATIAYALDVVGLSDRADALAGAMSNGEQRQLEIAMLIASGGSILVLDEPLAGMGPEETRRVVDLLRDLRRNHTIVLIEHDMDAVFAVADTLTVLALGRLIAHGSPDEVRRNGEVISAYLGGHAPQEAGA
ncbi:MAG: branched-chain amino acid ABC transporter ATP-binding protein/permease [Hyphomicrobiales bacterium]|nr:branched-chain amino acid ABC transporter ATP-binding protein/permease [Hyphomicrobiales bacterium]